MLKRLARAEADFDEWAQVLFDQAMLAEGALPANPAAYVQRVHRLLAA
jgi:molecular chaperone HtpG